jgi:hypothetical protein
MSTRPTTPEIIAVAIFATLILAVVVSFFAYFPGVFSA